MKGVPDPMAVWVARPRDEWYDEDGPVLWWKFPVNEPPHVGWMYDAPDYCTHWTPIPIPQAPDMKNEG